MPKLNFLVRAAICTLLIFLPLQGMDQWFYDRFFRLRGPEKGATSLILIRVNDAKLYPLYIAKDKHLPHDEFEFEPHPRSYWYHDFYETLLRKIESDEPRLIIFTNFFEGMDQHPIHERSFENVLFSGFLNEENKLIPPSSHLENNDYGFNNIFPDLDNIVRRSHLVYSSGSSLALRTYHRLNQEPIKRNLLDPLWIDFRGPAGTYPNYDAWDVFEGSPNGRFKGKIVVVGRESSPSSDLETPYGRMSRLEIQANTIDSFLRHTDVTMAPHWVTLCLAGLAVVLAVVIILYFPLTLSWLFLLLLSLVFILVTLFLFSQFKLWVGIANAIFCIFGTHLLMLGFKLGRQEEQQWKIQQETEYLREMDQFKNNFISLFSHDLKTPIAKIKAVTDRLLTQHNASLTNDVKEGLKTIDRTNSELARFISDILKVTKMESMSLEPVKEVIDINRLVENAVSRLKFLADEKSISILMDLEPLFSMEGDQNLIQEVVTNLLENAIKYSQNDRRVIVRTREEERFVRVSVIDEGEGIAPDEIPRVTGKFYRGRAMADKVKGSGLGLYLAKYFVEQHLGRLEIKSELGRGTEVSFWLPIAV